jgi:chemotaxis methyl-accepting protein methylase
MDLTAFGRLRSAGDERAFDDLARLVRTRAGISLRQRKQALVVARVAPRMRALGCRDLARQRLVTQAARVLRPEGLFFVGQSESLSGLQHGGLRQVAPSVYEKS